MDFEEEEENITYVYGIGEEFMEVTGYSAVERTLMATTVPLSIIKQGSKWGILWGVLLILLGILAIAEPLLAAIALATFLAWLLIFVGVVHLAVGFHAHSGKSMGWKLLIGICYIFIGGYLLFRPLVGVATLTLMLAFLFFLEGVLDFMLWWKT